MTGRGIDQILPYPGDPELHEPYARSALEYVQLAERLNGAIPAPVGFEYVWGDALAELESVAPDARVINLETSVTTSDNWEPKGINYRMHPRNVPCLSAAGIDCCVLANNHVLDWGPEGLDETLSVLHEAGFQTAGAGRGEEEAGRPGVMTGDWGRLLVFGFAGPDCGVPPSWAAGEQTLGVSYLPDFSNLTALEVVSHVRRYRRRGDTVIASIHWGSNWGYEVPEYHQIFAHRLIDSGAIDVIHGHSSHHPRGVEIYEGRVILYGCGDLISDYEGISGYEEFRGELVLTYFVTLDQAELRRLRMTPFQLERLQLRRASETDTSWCQETLDRESSVFGTRIVRGGDGGLEARWG